MAKVAALIILLVGLAVNRAHDTRRYDSAGGWNSASYIASQGNENLSKDGAHHGQSVVVNWLLVCADLCRIGYCGLKCEYCQKFGQNNTQLDMVMPSSAEVCPVLCDYDLGGRKCQCTTRPSQSAARDLTRLCDGFCNRFNIQLNGCSPCQILALATTTLKSQVPEHDPTGSSNGNDHQPNDTEHTPPIPTIENSSTPNWNEVCSSLCKTGEGGILCNCDQSPLNVL